MLNSLKLQFMQHKLLLLTILGSILLHIALFSEFSITLPQLSDEQQTLEMHLANQKSQQEAMPTPDKNVKAESKPKPAKSSQQPKPAAVNTPEPAHEPANLTDNSALSASTNIDQNRVELADDTDNINAPAESILDGEELKEPPYNHVETEFEVMRGINTPAAGVTKVVFNIDANDQYSIISSTQAKGLAALFFGNLTQKSEGTVTENGLQPDFYSYQYGNDAKKSQTANFNWSDNVVHMHSSRGDTSANLVAGTQDFLSFMYQFMFTPPLDNMQITMTNGKRLRTYAYSFEGEETITTKMGELKTIHLLKSSGDEEKTEIWLASDYQYLPVRIRKTEKDGTVIEQLATNIQTKALD